MRPLDRGERLYVAGHTGLVGSALLRALEAAGFSELVVASHQELDLRAQRSVQGFLDAQAPRTVIIAAGTVGGIIANLERPADFLYDNMMIHANLIDAAYRAGVERVLYLGSSCIYPRHAPQPITEASLLGGTLEPTNEYYAIAKIAGIKLCDAYRIQHGASFISAMPTNLYGPGDNFDPVSSHLLPGLIQRFHLAKVRGEGAVEVWGTGAPRRELLHADDLAAACLFLLDHFDERGPINVGTSIDQSIAEIADQVRSLIYPEAEIFFDAAKPDGMPRKVLDVSRIHDLGWHHQIEFADGLAETYRWYLENLSSDIRGATMP